MELRRLQLLFLLFLTLVLLITGSQPQRLKSSGMPETVVRVEIHCHSGRNYLHRTYTMPQKIQPFLTYLRLLRYCGQTGTDPERLEGTAFWITLHYSSGRQQVYRQRCDRFLSRGGRSWHLIDPRQAKFLYPLVLAVPGD